MFLMQGPDELGSRRENQMRSSTVWKYGLVGLFFALGSASASAAEIWHITSTDGKEHATWTMNPRGITAGDAEISNRLGKTISGTIVQEAGAYMMLADHSTYVCKFSIDAMSKLVASGRYNCRWSTDDPTESHKWTATIENSPQ
jgi:hypothetical protein